jgi:type I restriction enzyme S subunit
MSELPDGWVEACLDELAESVRNGVFVSRPADAPPGEPILRISAVRPMRLDLSDIRYARQLPDNSETARLAAGDLLFTRYSGTRDFVGACAVVGEEGVGLLHPDKLIRVVPNGAIASPRYLAAFSSSPLGRQWLEGAMKTTAGQTGLAGSDLRRLPVAVAPRAEQERIVAAIEEAFSKLDAGEAGLRTVRQRLKRMRDAILTAAVTGRLVPQDPTDTPATKLLADLGTQAFPSELLATVPPTWAPTTLGDVAAMSLGKMLDAKAQSGEHPKRYLRNTNVRWDSFDLSDLAFMDIRPEEFDRVAVTDGDLVVCEGGQPGRCAVWRGEPIAIQKALHRVRPKHGVSGAYLSLVVRWWVTRPEYERFITGTTIKHIPKEKLRLLPVPLPPSEEQARIVTEVERQLSFVDACERAVDAGLARSAALRRSVLKAAFEGRLVPQDPSDEPASVLLERIRAERAAAPGQQGKRRKKAEAS